MVDPTGFEPVTFWNYTQGMLLGLMYTARALFNQTLYLSELRALKGQGWLQAVLSLLHSAYMPIMAQEPTIPVSSFILPMTVRIRTPSGEPLLS